MTALERPASDRPTRTVRHEGFARLGTGAVVAERYRILRTIGIGAMGSVYEAEHVTVGRHVALKVLHPGIADEDIARRFRAEARAASAPGHPNVVDVFDAGELADGRPFIAMELLRGRTVFEVVEQGGSLSLERAVRIGLEVAKALAAAHAVGIVHRDLKAENVMLVEREGEQLVKVLDFGIAHGVDDGTGRATRHGLAMGTPEYMAPEQGEGKPATPQFDLYALGVLLFEMVSGEPPILADTPLQIVAKKTTEDAPSLRTVDPNLPYSFVALVDACLARDPTDRPPSADDVAARLTAVARELAAGRPVAAAQARRRGVGLWIGAAAVMAFAVALGVFTVHDGAEDGDPTAAVTPDASPPVRVVTPPTIPDAAPKPEPPEAPPPEAPPPETPPPVHEAAPLPSVAETVDKPAAPRAETARTPRPRVSPDAACNDVEKSARQARRKYLWPQVLEAVKKRECWTHESERRKLHVLSLKELEKFSACVEAARGNTDPEVMQWATTCEKRR